MPEKWIIRVQGNDYGPAELATLHEWKSEGRVLPTNPARHVDVETWGTAADIPDLFEVERPPVQAEPGGHRSASGSEESTARREVRGQQSEVTDQRTEV